MEEGRSFLSIRQAAKISSLSVRFLYELCQNRKIKFFKCGRRIVIDRADLEVYITSEPVEAIDWEEKAREMLK